MFKSSKLFAYTTLIFLSVVPLLHAEPMQDPFFTQGQTTMNAPSVYGIQENVDLFSGRMSLLHTDAHFPGNGGLDLTLMRKYNSGVWGRRDVTPMLVGDKDPSALGMGWSMHMGIVRNPYAATGGDNYYVSSNPVVEMPDGSQHVLYADKNGPMGQFISKDYWRYKMVPGYTNRWELTLTDGTVYTFEQSPNTDQAGYDAYGGTHIAQAIKIQNATRTSTITITYDKSIVLGMSLLKTITDSIGRQITFTYNATHQLDAIFLDSNTKLISYRYQTVSGPNGPFSVLTQATLPEPGDYAALGNWKYAYNSKYELQALTYPNGGTITYDYSDVPFYIKRYNEASQPLVSFSVVTGRTMNSLTTEGTGTWSYAYVTGGTSTTDVIFNTTTVTAPAGVTEIHNFFGWGACKSGWVWAIGLPASKEYKRNGITYYFESNSWMPTNKISYDAIGNSSWNNGAVTAYDDDIYVPSLVDKEIFLDGAVFWDNNGIPWYEEIGGETYLVFSMSTEGASFKTINNSFDQYGNPTSITEYGEDLEGNATAARNTSKTYYHNVEKNIVQGRPENITVSSAATGTYVTTNTYDPATGSLMQTNKNGVATDFTYDSATYNLASITDANTHRTYFDWNNGRISGKTNQYYSVHRNINRDGTIASETNGRTYTTSYAYDGNYRLKSTTPPDQGQSATSFTYAPSLDTPNASFKKTSRGGFDSTTYFDGFGRASRTVDSLGKETTVVYSPYGPTYSSTANVGDTTYYDLLGRVTQIVHQDLQSIDYYYWGNYTNVYDELKGLTFLEYLSYGSPDDKRLISVSEALNNSAINDYKTTYEYNTLGSLTRINQPGGVTRSFTYDPEKNFLLAEMHPDRGVITYTRDGIGNIKTRTDGMGTAVYSYDELNRLTDIVEGQDALSFGYDNADNRTAVNNATAQLVYTYDAGNRLTRKSETIGNRNFNINYTYDENDNLTDIHYPSSRDVHYTFNPFNQVTGVDGFGGSVSNILYYTAAPRIGLPYQLTFPNGHTTTLTYNLRNLTTGILAGTTAVSMSYGYDPRGNTETITDNLDNSRNQALTYDALNRTIGFGGAWGAGAFSYDALGNRRTKNIGSNGTTYGYTNNRLASVTSAGTAETYAYNMDGDLTDNGRTLVYNAFHNLVTYENNGTPLAQYAYDGDGMRVSKTPANGKSVVYHYGQGGNVLTESDGNGNFIVDYVYLHGKLVAKVANDAFVIPPVPAKPTNLTAQTVSSSQINLTWVDRANNEEGFVIERKIAGESAYARVATLPADTISYSDAGLTENTTYSYRAWAYNAGGPSSFSNEASAWTFSSILPIPPSGLTAAVTAGNHIDLAWIDNSNDESTFVIERKIGSLGTYAQIATLSQNVTAYEDTTEMPNTVYVYRVKASNASGDSPYSNEAGASTPVPTLGGTIFTMAGNGQLGNSGDGGPATLAQISARGVAADGAGNVYIISGSILRKVDTAGIITTLTSNAGYGSEGITVDSAGNIYLADPYYHVIWKLNTSGLRSIVAGVYQWAGYNGDGLTATSAVLNGPTGVAFDSAGNMYIADSGNNRVRVVDTSGIIDTLAGNGAASYSGDGGRANMAALKHPKDVKVDNAGNVYIADTGNCRVRKVDTSRIITTVAGSGQCGFSGDGGPATSANVSPYHVAVDTVGDIYLSEYSNGRIRMVDNAGTITTIAGNGVIGFSGDGGLPQKRALTGLMA